MPEIGECMGTQDMVIESGLIDGKTKWRSVKCLAVVVEIGESVCKEQCDW